MFLHVSVILLTVGVLYMSLCLVAWSHVPPRVSVFGPMFHVPSRGMSLFGGVSVKGVSVGRPPESEKQAVCILLECILTMTNYDY